MTLPNGYPHEKEFLQAKTLFSLGQYFFALAKRILSGNQKTKHLKPISGKELGIELSKHHIYLSASINEPAGMHHIEGAMSGLPILYINSGGVTEYCKNYGLEYTYENLSIKLDEIVNKYDFFTKRLEKYEFTGEAMNRGYLDLFQNLLNNKKELLSNRKNFKLSNFKNQYKILNYYFYL